MSEGTDAPPEVVLLTAVRLEVDGGDTPAVADGEEEPAEVVVVSDEELAPVEVEVEDPEIAVFWLEIDKDGDPLAV